MFEREAVIALDEDAGKIGGYSIGSHDPARPERIPKKEDGEAGEHAPMRKLRTAGFKNKLCQECGIMCAEMTLGGAAEPGSRVRQ